MTFDPVAYKQAITQEWGRAAQGWHRWIPAINAWLSVATETMLDQAGVGEGCRVIDIAAGDGGQSVAAAGRVGPSGEVLATDIASEFVKLANAVASEMGLTQLSAQVMDAESLTLPDDRFDAAISRLGLMYLPDLRRGLLEIKRVLRPGGRLSAVVFTTAAGYMLEAGRIDSFMLLPVLGVFLLCGSGLGVIDAVYGTAMVLFLLLGVSLLASLFCLTLKRVD